MDKLLTIFGIFCMWVMVSAWHSLSPDLTIITLDDADVDISKIIEEKKPIGFLKIRSHVVVKSTTMNNKYCVWYVRQYDVPDFVWDEMRKQGRLKCK